MLALFSKVPKIQRPKALKSTFSITPLLSDAPSPGNPREYPHKAYIVRNNVIGLHLRRQECGSIFIQIFVVDSERHCFVQWSA